MCDCEQTSRSHVSTLSLLSVTPTDPGLLKNGRHLVSEPCQRTMPLHTCLVLYPFYLLEAMGPRTELFIIV